MSSAWKELAENLGAVALVISLWAHLITRVDFEATNLRLASSGLAFGVAASVSILMAVELSEGIFIDLRLGLLAGAIWAGGPLAGGLALLFAIAARSSLGGEGVPDAIVGLVVTYAVSISVHHLCRRRSSIVAQVAIVVMMPVVWVTLLMSLPTMVEINALSRIGLPYLVLNTAAIILTYLVVEGITRGERENKILRAALKQAPDFLYVKDRNSKFIAVNNNTARHNRYDSPRAMVGLDDFALVSGPRAEELYEQEQEIIRERRPLINKLERIGKHSFLTSKVPLRDSDGSVLGIAGVTRDITASEKLERDVRESRNELAHALESMTDGFVIFDKNGILVMCNQHYRETFPKTGHLRVPGASIVDLLKASVDTKELLDVPEGTEEAWLLNRAKTLQSDTVQEMRLSDGRWHSLKVKWTDEKAYIVVSDITAMKLSESSLRETAETFRALADTDGLTGLSNRRAFDGALRQELSIASKLGSHVSLLLIDIDRFKAYNDTYGHPAGDECLRTMSRCLQETIKRRGDVVARYGGEEFVVILPRTDQITARTLAEDFRTRLVDCALSHGASEFGVVTASVGIATASPQEIPIDAEAFIKRADEALYEAKARGRNQSCNWRDINLEVDQEELAPCMTFAI